MSQTFTFIPNYVKGILDEIALEGLDGITPNDLWVRLNDRLYFPLKPNDEPSKSFLWDAVKQLKSVSFYELPEPRSPLVVFDRFEHIDPELGMIIEPDNMPQTIYPHCKIDDPAFGIVGSCATYYTRKDVTDSVRLMSYEEVNKKWGHKLVAVATQAARRRALHNPDVNPNLELTTMQYIVLERIGRSRYHGEITQGRDSLQTVGEDAKSLFYLRKVLHKHRLITKQMFHQKLGSQNTCGLLLHLPRFFVERRPKALTMTENVVTYLKSKPKLMEEYNILRQNLNLGSALKKLSKTFNFQKFVKSEVVLHRVMYPNATESEWRYKGANKERSVRVLYLVDPNLDAKDVWQKYDDIYDDEDDDKCGLLDEGHRLLDRTMMAQAYSVLEKAGPEGVTQVELGSSLGASKLAARMLVRNMTKSNKVTMFMKDEGRQRTAKFALKKFDKCSDLKKQMSEEKDKLIKLVKKSNKEKKQTLASQAGSAVQTMTSKDSTQLSDTLESNLAPKESVETVYIKSEDVVEESEEVTPPKKLAEKRKLNVNDTDSDFMVTVKDNPNLLEISNNKRKKLEPQAALGKEPNEKSENKKKETQTLKKGMPKESTPAQAADKQEEQEEIQMEISSPDVIRQELVHKKSLSATPGALESRGVSFRLLKRTNMIMEAVHKQKVIFDTSKLQKMIYEEEVKEGYGVRMDKKSLLRIINKLALENHVKHLQITLRGYGKVKVLTFICHPSVTTDHSVIQSAVDQAKMKFNIIGKEALRKKVKHESKKMAAPHQPEAVETLHENTPAKPLEENINLKYNGRVGRIYGFKPKYMRMQVLHKYMFYLIYGYDGDENLDQTKAMAEIESQTEVSEEVKAEMSHIYTPSMDWKMFLPPLPVHNGYKDGWALMSDMLLRLPLSLFIQVVNVMYELPDIEDYLNHPIKKHFLVKNLPMNFRTALTYARKYIFTIHEQVVRLCCTGLLQMGPQRLKEKDQVFVFLNRRALLWDTTSSPVGYHQIAKNHDYPIHQYYFHNMADVEQYWYDLWNFCMHTMLGGRMCMSGKTVVLEGLQNKPDMLAALESRNVEEASSRDIGYLPGDHLGAAGFDSAMFAHLKRNWYWNTTKTHLGSSSSPAPAPTTELQPIIHITKERKMATKPLRMISETSSARRRARRDSKPEPKESQRAVKKKLIIKKTVRMLKHRKMSVRKPYYDQIDREALLKMSKLRVDWSAKEDNLLLLCKVAFVIFQYVGKRYHNLVTVRQILHDQCPEATDKTSRACQRRLNYIMKNSQTQRSVNLCVEEMKQDQVVMKKLQDLAAMLGTSADGRPKMPQEEREERWAEGYRQLVLLLQERYKRLHSQDLSHIGDTFVLPDTAQQLFENYNILRPQKFKKRGFNSIHGLVDIQSGVINATILSSLNCVGDKTSWSYQLFNIYQQYPDKLLRAVMAKTRADQMVSLRKRYLRTHMRSGDYLPLSSSPYQLSISYINLLLTRYQSELYRDCLDMYQRLADACQSSEVQTGEGAPMEEVVASKGGIAACVVEFATQEQMEFKLDIPDQIIVMDPNVIQKDETYTRIVQRYQDILSKCKEPDQITMTAIFDEAYNTYSQDSTNDEEVTRPAQGQNTIAKAATRIALYLTREECDRTMEQKEVQHAHDFFVVNASRVFCRFKGVNVDGEEKLQHLVPVSDNTVSNIINRIKTLAVLPDKGDEDDKVAEEVSSQLQLSRQFVQELISFIKSKKEMGATTQDIREQYGVCRETAEVLRALVDCQACLRTGINESRLVHWEAARPWVIRSYRLLRFERERLIDANRTSYGMAMNVGENTEPNPTNSVSELVEEQKEESKEDTKPQSVEESSGLTIEENKEPAPSTSSTLRPPPPLIPLRPRRTSHKDQPVSEVHPEQQVKRSNAKFISTCFRKIKKAIAFDPKTKCNLNVCVRPWIKINGTLNRRVLDKFLSSVLGHIMILPLCSLKMVQDRFLPAFQPHHTRELVEILAEIKCVEMLAVQHSHKPSLFSKPTKVSTVPATGLEREEDILIEPDPMAVSRLACFIGETAYLRDIFTTS